MSDIEHQIVLGLEALFPTTQFILADRNGVEPQSVYCLVNVLSSDTIGLGETPLYNNNQQTTYSENKIVNLRLQHFGLATSSAGNDAEYLNIVLSSFNGKYEFYNRGLSITKVTGVLSAGVLRDTKMYKTYVNDVTILTRTTITMNMPSIDRIEAEGTYETEDAVITQPINME